MDWYVNITINFEISKTSYEQYVVFDKGCISNY